MNNKLIEYKNESPIKFIILVLLYAVGATSLPLIPKELFSFSETTNMLLYIILKIITIGFGIYLICTLNYKNVFNFNIKNFIIAVVLYLPCLLVCINNFPIVALLTKNATLNIKTIKFLLYILICLSIAVFEEVLFRGIIFNIFQEKKSNFKAIIFSSLIFSLAHLVNAFSLNVVFLLMQLGYSFLIGAMCAVAYTKSKSIYLPIIYHFIFDLGGLLTDYNLVSGNIWDKWSIIVTAILGVFTFIYTIIVYFKDNKKNESSIAKSE